MLKLYSCSAASTLVLMVPLPDCTPTPIPSLSISVSHASTGRLVITLMDEQARREKLWVSHSGWWRFSAPRRPHGALQSPPDFDTSFPLWFVARLRLKETRKFSVLMRTDGCCSSADWAEGCFFSPSWWTKPPALWRIGFMLHYGLLMTGYYSTFSEIDLLFFFYLFSGVCVCGGVTHNWLFFQESVIYYLVKYLESGKRISHWSSFVLFSSQIKVESLFMIKDGGNAVKWCVMQHACNW